MGTTLHVPVLAQEVLELLALKPGMIAIDGTLGGGGHTELLLNAVLPGGRVLALDRDPRAIAAAQVRFAGKPVDFVQANFCELPDVFEARNLNLVDAILLDLGLSSDQLADQQRGFSFAASGELDLRFSPHEGEPAWSILQRLSERELADVIFQFGEERYSRRIARKIVETRRTHPIRTSDQLAELVRRCVPRSPRMKIDPATRTFQALRIFVNDELGSLERALKEFPQCLKPEGRLAIISFHSLEDRIVKHTFREDERYTILTKKPIRPNEAELQRNVRSRSARLRGATLSSGQGRLKEEA
jgi:16S rRNA (cytosine1402-N4)-methyltransferase